MSPLSGVGRDRAWSGRHQSPNPVGLACVACGKRITDGTERAVVAKGGVGVGG